jgi:hypothetical protein
LPNAGSRLRNGAKPSREPLKNSAMNTAYDDNRAVTCMCLCALCGDLILHSTLCSYSDVLLCPACCL